MGGSREDIGKEIGREKGGNSESREEIRRRKHTPKLIPDCLIMYRLTHTHFLHNSSIDGLQNWCFVLIGPHTSISVWQHIVLPPLAAAHMQSIGQLCSCSPSVFMLTITVKHNRPSPYIETMEGDTPLYFLSTYLKSKECPIISDRNRALNTEKEAMAH